MKLETVIATVMEEVVERRLAAILFADVVGYSRLMGEDETGTLAALKAHRSELIDPEVAENNGRIVTSTGDGVLVEFGSVVDAVNCAVQIQMNMTKRNANVPDGRELVFRIGVNLGDIIFEDEDIIGDGVNVAARLEGLAEPGGICVSRSVRNQIRDKVPYGFEDLGEKAVKNIARPVRVFRVLMDGQKAAPARLGKRWATSARHFTAALAIILLIVATGAAVRLGPWAPDAGPSSVKSVGSALPHKPSIAILPFGNLSADPEQEYFGDGITLDIITDLSKFSNLLVIAANSTFRYKGQLVKPQDVSRDLGARYVLVGSVQKIQGQIRINAQLIDATTGYHVWADRYDRRDTDPFAVQNEIARKIVETIGPVSEAHGKLLKVELERLARVPTQSLESYDHFLKGVVHYDKFAKEHNRQARSDFDKALQLEPHYAKAMAKKAWTYMQEFWNGWGDDYQKSLNLALRSAQEAIATDPGESTAHRALGSVRLFLRKHDLAINSFRKAVELNPNGTDLIMHYGWALTYSGSADEGLRIMEEAISRNPYHPGWYLWNVAWGYFVTHRYEDAIAALEKRSPKSNFTHLMLAVNYAKVGRHKESADSIKTFRKLEPVYSIETAATAEPFKNKQDLEHYLDALREVGVPEKTPKN